MSAATDGQICYGILLEEGVELPWNVEKHDHDLEDWWRKVNSYVASFQPWTDEGEYAEGWSRGDPRFKEYYAHQEAWNDAHPVPVTVVNCCSNEYPIWIIADPKSVVVCSRGYPRKLISDQLGESNLIADQELVEFCESHGIPFKSKPCWYLSSYWG